MPMAQSAQMNAMPMAAATTHSKCCCTHDAFEAGERAAVGGGGACDAVGGAGVGGCGGGVGVGVAKV